MKIAFVKQDVYPDLYIGNKENTPAQLLFSSMGRVGPIGLFTLLGADFYIIKEEHTPECISWEKIHGRVYKNDISLLRKIQYLPLNEIEGQEFKVPGTTKTHKDYAISAYNIKWQIYDVVISINFSIPQKIVLAHPNILWCYMISEPSTYMDKIYFNYDISLRQETNGIISKTHYFVDFPYTFTGPFCLEKILFNELGRRSKQTGIYIEINSTPERPAIKSSHLLPLEKTGHPVIIHNQNIKKNLISIYDSKYFVKIGGRTIRGNSIIESISAGTLVLMSPNDLFHTQLLPKECWIENMNDAITKIERLNSDQAEYERLLKLQRNLVKHFVVDIPLLSIQNSIKNKRACGNKKSQENKLSNVKGKLKNMISRISKTMS